MQRYDKYGRLKTFLSARNSPVTDDDLKEMLVLPPGMIFKDMRKFRAALAEALVPESKNVTCLEPNPFLYSESDTMWSKKEDNDDNPSYDQFIEHYTIADPKPQLLKSIFGLQKGPKKSTSNLPAENYNDPTQYSTNPLVNENDKLKRQIESAQLLKLNKELTKQLQNLNDSSHSNKHHKKKHHSLHANDSDTSESSRRHKHRSKRKHQETSCTSDSEKENKRRRKSHKDCKESSIAVAQKSIDDID